MTETLLDAFDSLSEAWKAAEKKCKEVGYPFFVAVPIAGLEEIDCVDKGLQLGWERTHNGMRISVGSVEKGWNPITDARTDVRMLAVNSFPDLLKSVQGEAVELEKDLNEAAIQLRGFL